MGKVIEFPKPPDVDLWPLRRFPAEEANWSPDQRHFMRPDTWRMRFDIRLAHHKVAAFERGDGWRWRVEHLPTGEVVWSAESSRPVRSWRIWSH